MIYAIEFKKFNVPKLPINLNELSNVLFIIRILHRLYIWLCIFPILAIIIYFLNKDSTLLLLGTYLLSISICVYLYFAKKNILLTQHSTIYNLHLYMQNLLYILVENLNVLQHNDFNNINNLSLMLQILSIDYYDLNNNFQEYLLLLRSSIYHKMYKDNYNNIIYDIINHPQLINIQYWIQKYCNENYNPQTIKQLDFPFMSKIWIVASVMNNQYYSEYLKYFEQQYDYYQLEPSHTKKDIQFYNLLYINIENIEWIHNNMNIICNLFDANNMYSYIYTKYYTQNKKTCMYQISKLICNMNLLHRQLLLIMPTLSLYDICKLIYKGLFYKFEFLLIYVVNSNKSVMIKGMIIVLNMIVNIFKPKKVYLPKYMLNTYNNPIV